jgi:GMP synthase-like glutamine amidotransferase
MSAMRALAITYEREAGPGVFADAMAERGVRLDEWARERDQDPPADPHSYDAVLSFGGAMNVDEEDRYTWLREQKDLLAELLDAEVPLLGVCLGSQLLAEAAGAAPGRAERPEIGWFDIEVNGDGAKDPVMGPLAPRFNGFLWHSYEAPLPPGAVALASSEVCLQAYRVGERAWGIQFHAEVTAADAEYWIDHYDNDADAVRMGFDQEVFRRQLRAAIGPWNALGRDLCGRWLDTFAR